MEDQDLKNQTFEEIPHAPRKYFDSDDPYAIKTAEEKKAPIKYPILPSPNEADEVKVSVSDPAIKEETLTKYVVYTVRVKATLGLRYLRQL